MTILDYAIALSQGTSTAPWLWWALGCVGCWVFVWCVWLHVKADRL